ncbi:MAG: GTPase domain-containing protein [Deltaproteobacteria bacterium]|nr:GTPase domain-containing protein [Deltaproteobacteria bacterium]
MSLINPLAREISAKIVYYGPGLSGKTTSLKYLYSVIKAERRGELVTLATEGDRTLFFDFLPISIERVQEMPVRLQLYTVPGQIFYAATRKLVLNGADGVVFVADSQEAARDNNRLSLQDLEDNLAEMGLDLARFPHVFQWNKRDLPTAMAVATMNAEYNHHGAPAFETCASKGTGVLQALKEISASVVRDLRRRQQGARRAPTGETQLVAEDGLTARLSAVASEAVEEATAPAAAPSLPVPTQPPPASLPARSALAGTGLSFAPLWPGDGAGVERVERHIVAREFATAVRAAAELMALLLDALPGTSGTGGPMARAALLGIDGREYLRLCRLASAPDAALTAEDALFALYLLVSARVKQQAL